MSAPITSHGLNGMSWCYLLFGLCLLEFKTCCTHFYICSILALMLCQNTDLWASSSVFSMPMWFMCSCVSTCYCRLLGMIMHLPFSNTPSITTSLSLYGQYGLMSVCSSSLVCGQPAIINVFSCWRWASCNDACCISSIDMQSGISTELWMPSTCMSISFIDLSLPSM